jgi:hypothetical protein
VSTIQPSTQAAFANLLPTNNPWTGYNSFGKPIAFSSQRIATTGGAISVSTLFPISIFTGSTPGTTATLVTSGLFPDMLYFINNEASVAVTLSLGGAYNINGSGASGTTFQLNANSCYIATWDATNNVLNITPSAGGTSILASNNTFTGNNTFGNGSGGALATGTQSFDTSAGAIALAPVGTTYLTGSTSGAVATYIGSQITANQILFQCNESNQTVTLAITGGTINGNGTGGAATYTLLANQNYLGIWDATNSVLNLYTTPSVSINLALGTSYTWTAQQTFSGGIVSSGITDSSGITASGGLTLGATLASAGHNISGNPNFSGGLTNPSGQTIAQNGVFAWGSSATVTTSATAPTILFQPFFVQTTAQFSVTSSTTLAEIAPGSGPALAANLVSGHTYKIEFNLLGNFNASPGGKIGLGGSATVSYILGQIAAFGETTAVWSNTTLASNTLGVTGAFNGFATQVALIVTCSGSGSFYLTFAQNASSATASAIQIGSSMMVTMLL